MRGHPLEYAVPSALPMLPPLTFDLTAQGQSATACPFPPLALLCCWKSWSPKGVRKTGLSKRKGGAGESQGHVRTPSSLDGSKPNDQGTYTEWMVKPTLYLSPAWLCFSDAESKHDAAAVTCQFHLGSVSLPGVARHEFICLVCNWHLCVRVRG